MKCEFQERETSAEGKTVRFVCRFLKIECPYAGQDPGQCPTAQAFDTVKD